MNFVAKQIARGLHRGLPYFIVSRRAQGTVQFADVGALQFPGAKDVL